MRLADIDTAHSLAFDRDQLVRLREDPRRVLLGPHAHDRQLLERVAPTIIGLVDERIAEIDQQLQALGVDVGLLPAEPARDAGPARFCGLKP